MQGTKSRKGTQKGWKPQASEEGDPRDFQNLKAWQLAHEVAVGVYKLTQRLEDGEPLVPLLVQHSAQASAQVAHSVRVFEDAEKIEQLQGALASLDAIKTQLLIARDVGALPQVETAFEKIEEAQAMIGGLKVYFVKKVQGD